MLVVLFFCQTARHVLFSDLLYKDAPIIDYYHYQSTELTKLSPFIRIRIFYFEKNYSHIIGHATMGQLSYITIVKDLFEFPESFWLLFPCLKRSWQLGKLLDMYFFLNKLSMRVETTFFVQFEWRNF